MTLLSFSYVIHSTPFHTSGFARLIDLFRKVMFVEVSTRLEYRLIYFPIFTVLKTDKIMTKAAIVNEIFLKWEQTEKKYFR